jgi:hypothetical protein
MEVTGTVRGLSLMYLQAYFWCRQTEQQYNSISGKQKLLTDTRCNSRMHKLVKLTLRY